MAIQTSANKTSKPIEYPTSDGRPMAETDLHREVMIDTIQVLEERYADQENVYVSGNMLIFYEEGNKRKHVAPDAFVVFGIQKKKRLYYLLWEEGKTLDVAIETTSKTTRREDKKKKWDLYRDVLKVREYILFDPTGDYLKPRLQGYHLIGADYVPIEMKDGRLPSEILGLQMEADGPHLRFFDPATQAWLRTPVEQLKIEKQRVEQEKQRADRLEEESHRLREQLERLRQQKQ